MEVGVLLVLVAGVMNASFALPMKFIRGWRWENIWIAWTGFALVILPVAVTLLTIPHLWATYHEAGSRLLFGVALFGLLWGVAQILFGLAIKSLGAGLAFAMVLGISAAAGSILPLIFRHRDNLHTPAGIAVFSGTLLVLIGVAISGFAGRMREAALSIGPSERKHSFRYGIAVAILSGLGAGCMNVAIDFGSPLTRISLQYGASPSNAINAVWLPLLLAGSVPNLAYCVHLLRVNNTFLNFRDQPCRRNWGLAGAMAALWLFSTLFYGIAGNRMGNMGAVVGWPLFMAVIVISSTLIGIATGEWKNSGYTPVRLQLIGSAFLIWAVIFLSRSQH